MDKSLDAEEWNLRLVFKGINFFLNLPRIGFEPTCLAAPDPEPNVSTNFTTWASL
jgi:hypothetical protein